MISSSCFLLQMAFRLDFWNFPLQIAYCHFIRFLQLASPSYFSDLLGFGKILNLNFYKSDFFPASSIFLAAKSLMIFLRRYICSVAKKSQNTRIFSLLHIRVQRMAIVHTRNQLSASHTVINAWAKSDQAPQSTRPTFANFSILLQLKFELPYIATNLISLESPWQLVFLLSCGCSYLDHRTCPMQMTFTFAFQIIIESSVLRWYDFVLSSPTIPDRRKTIYRMDIGFWSK